MLALFQREFHIDAGDLTIAVANTGTSFDFGVFQEGWYADVVDVNRSGRQHVVALQQTTQNVNNEVLLIRLFTHILNTLIQIRLYIIPEKKINA